MSTVSRRALAMTTVAVTTVLLGPLSASAAGDRIDPAETPENAAAQGKSRDQGPPSDASAADADGRRSSKKDIELEQVVVTGSRLTETPIGPARAVQIYTREQVDKTGQTTVADFLNTVPAVAVAVAENGIQTRYASTTVKLRGLPYGTTMVLINGRRVESSGLQGSNDFFDLNNLPLAAVDRIEMVPDGSSAVYGSDAIAGIVNIILRNNFDGLEMNAKYGAAADISEWDSSAAYGIRGDKGHFSIVASYQTRSDLQSSKRRLTASNDYSAYSAQGGFDNNFPTCHPGNVFSINGKPLPGAPPGSNATYAAVTGNLQSGKPSFSDFAYGVLNECSVVAGDDLIPATHRGGVYASGAFSVTPDVELFSELLYSRVQLYQTSGPPSLFGATTFQSYTVAASNPYNPFGETVGIADVFSNLPTVEQIQVTNFLRPLIGARGDFAGAWHWEVAAWSSEDRTSEHYPFTKNQSALRAALNSSDPTLALNPFIAGPAAPAAVLNSVFFDPLWSFQGHGKAIDGFVRGTTPGLPAGRMEIVLGGEYDHDTLISNNVNNPNAPIGEQSFSRHSTSVFGEARIPLVSSSVGRQTLTATAAGRFDRYSDFGHVTTPQYGLEWRLFDALLLRATYAESFKAPPLPDLLAPVTSTPSFYKDPKTGLTDAVIVISGGNPALRPETGRSHTFGISYAGEAVPGLRASATYWRTRESNNIENLGALVLIQNESVFPNNVIRASACASGPPCPITEVLNTSTNFGYLDVAGVDYELRYRYPSGLGIWSIGETATQTFHYTAVVHPGTAPSERTSKASDDGNWAPRWKAVTQLGWTRGPFDAYADARYVGSYQDYDSTQRIGNFWLVDASVTFKLGISAPHAPWPRDIRFTIGATNLFNRAPQFSNYEADYFGYDPAQADIRGRFLYAQVGAKW